MGLVLQIKTLTGHGPLNRSIELDCSIENKLEGRPELAIMEASVTVKTSRGLTIAEGFYLRQYHTKIDLAIYQPGPQYPCNVSFIEIQS